MYRKMLLKKCSNILCLLVLNDFNFSEAECCKNCLSYESKKKCIYRKRKKEESIIPLTRIFSSNIRKCFREKKNQTE